jgi:hypothetical protein
MPDFEHGGRPGLYMTYLLAGPTAVASLSQGAQIHPGVRQFAAGINVARLDCRVRGGEGVAHAFPNYL